MRRPHVVIMSAEFPPVGGGGVIRPLKLAKYLPRLGWQVTVLCSDERLANAYDESLLDEIPPDVRVIRTGPGLASASGSIARGARERFGRTSPLIGTLRTIRGAARAVWAIPDHRIGWALSAQRRADAFAGADVIVSTGPPHSTHVGAALVARRRGLPLILDFRDEWTLNPFYVSRNPMRRAIERALERRSLTQAAGALFVSDVSRERYARAHPALASRFGVIPNGYDPADFEGLDASRTPAGAVVRIGYAGSLDHRRDGRPLFEAIARRLRQHEADVALTMVGPISPRQRALAEAAIPASQLEIAAFLPHREAIATMLRCDALLVVTNTEEAGPAALTGKIFEYLAMRRPILVVAHRSAATELVDESGAGVWADPGDAAGLDEAIDRIVGLARQTDFAGMDPAELDHYDREKQAAVWDGLLREAIGSGPR